VTGPSHLGAHRPPLSLMCSCTGTRRGVGGAVRARLHHNEHGAYCRRLGLARRCARATATGVQLPPPAAEAARSQWGVRGLLGGLLGSPESGEWLRDASGGTGRVSLGCGDCGCVWGREPAVEFRVGSIDEAQGASCGESDSESADFERKKHLPRAWSSECPPVELGLSLAVSLLRALPEGARA
jgi:hypothetical protein